MRMQDRLKEFGLIKFDPNKIDVNDVYDMSVFPNPERVRQAFVLNDGKIVCQWLNGTVSYANTNYLAMRESSCTNEKLELKPNTSLTCACPQR